MNAVSGTAIQHDIGPAGLVAVRLHSSGLRIRAVDGSTAQISAREGLDGSVSVERGPGSLSIKASRGVSVGIGGMGIDVGRPTPDLEVDVPRGATVVVETASGDMTVDGLAGDQRYRTASGTIVLRGVAGQLTVDAVSGDVSIAADGECAVIAKTVSGDLQLRAGTLRRLRVSTTSGDMRIEGRLAGDGPFGIESVSGDTILAPLGGVTVAVKSVTGDIRSDVASTTSGGRSTRTVTVGDGTAQLTLRSISGDLRIVRPSTAALAAPRALIPPAPPAPARPLEAPEAPTIAIAPPPATTEDDGDPLAPESSALGSSDPSLAILEQLERGEIDVAEASRQLAALDDGTPA